MKYNSMKTLASLGMLMLPLTVALADAPVVQGHSFQQSATGASSSQSSSAPSTVVTDSSNPTQALVTDDSDSSPDSGSGTALPNTSNTLDLGNQMSILQQDVQDLRGQVEVQGHTIEQMQAQLNQLTAKGSTQSSATATVAPTTAAITSTPAAVTPTPSTTATPATNTTPSTTASANPASESQLYQQAYNLMAAKQYTQATTALQNYLQQYPNGVYGADAHYWLGEMDLIAGNSTQAQTQFTAVINQFKQSPKVADSMLKLGMIYYEQANWAAAKTQFNTIVKQYPNTTTAQLAEQQLQQIQQSGN